jgi:N-methylhydantoinase B
MKFDAQRSGMLDPIAMEVFSNRLLSITEDMNNTLVRSSFSTNIKERRDCSVALFDDQGRLVAQGTQIPLHLGSLAGGVEAVLRDVPASAMRDGDVFVCNDPYLANGSHLPDINLITPVFFEGELVAFAANTGHHSDVGGAVPGSIAGGSRSIFEEGIRIPVTRLVAAGETCTDLMKLIVSNTRDPVERELDLRVQIATNARGAQAFRDLIRRQGLATVRQVMSDVIAYTRRRIGNRIAELAEGEHGFTSYLDDDGMGGDPVPITVTVRVAAGRLHFDFAGSGKQARGAINVPINALKACVYYAVKALLDPELPPNAGLFEPIDIDAPAGTIVNPDPPAACGARSITCQKIAGTIFGAFRDLLPTDRVMASSNDTCPAIVFSGALAKRAGQYVYMETLGGGSGARFDQDGMNGVHVHMTNTSNLPAEALENEYPLLLEEYGLVEDSGGAGRTRGGLGIVRQIRALVPGTIFSARSDSHTVGVAAGVLGGADGRRARLVRNPGRSDEQVLFSKVARLELGAGDSVRIETPGAGGCGRPADRPQASLLRDLRDGYVSIEQARTLYGGQRVDALLARSEQAMS